MIFVCDNGNMDILYCHFNVWKNTMSEIAKNDVDAGDGGGIMSPPMKEQQEMMTYAFIAEVTHAMLSNWKRC